MTSKRASFGARCGGRRASLSWAGSARSRCFDCFSRAKLATQIRGTIVFNQPAPLDWRPTNCVLVGGLLLISLSAAGRARGRCNFRPPRESAAAAAAVEEILAADLSRRATTTQLVAVVPRIDGWTGQEARFQLPTAMGLWDAGEPRPLSLSRPKPARVAFEVIADRAERRAALLSLLPASLITTLLLLLPLRRSRARR